jgi:hypothetical protein
MAEVFEEVEITQDLLVKNLIKVENLSNMQKGDLIVVNNVPKSVAFRSGTNGYLLTTDTTSSTNLAWKSVGQSLGFTASGQLITSITGGNATILGQGTLGQVLTVNSSGMPRWQTPASFSISSGVINFSIEPGQITTRATGRNFSFFTWDQSEYGSTGGTIGTDSLMSLTAGNLQFYADGAGAKVNAVRIAGSSTTATLFSEVTTVVGVNQARITPPNNDSLYRFGASGTSGVNMYGFQMHFKSLRLPVP